MALGDFDSKQSSIDFGMSLLGDKEERDRRARKKQKKIKNVSYLLGAIGVADMFLANKARRKVEDFTLNLNAEKALELDKLSKATTFKTDVLNTLGKHIDWSDPNTWVEGGAAHTALAEQLGATRKGGLTPRSSYSTQQFDSDEEKQYRDQLYQAVLDDGSFTGLKKRYDEHKGIIDSSATLINAKYKDILSRTTKEFMSPQNTSSIRRLLGSLGLVDKDLDKLDKGEYISKPKKQEELKVIEEAIIQNSNNYVKETPYKSLQESFDAMTTGGKRLVITDLQKYNQTEDKRTNGFLTGDEEAISLTGEKSDVSTLTDKFNSYDITVPLSAEDSISLGDLFGELNTTEQTHFIKNLKGLITRQLKTQDALYLDQGITDVRAYVTDEMIETLLRENMVDPEKGMIVVKTEKTRGWFGFEGQTRNYTIKDYGTFIQSMQTKKQKQPDPADMGPFVGEEEGLDETVTFDVKLSTLQKAINAGDEDEINRLNNLMIEQHPDRATEYQPMINSFYKSQKQPTQMTQPAIPSDIPEGYELRKKQRERITPLTADREIGKRGEDLGSTLIKGADKGIKWWNAQIVENRIEALQEAVDTGNYGAVGSILAKEAGGYKELKQLNQSEKRSLARQIILKLRG